MTNSSITTTDPLLTGYRAHYMTRFGTTGLPFEYYRGAYDFGRKYRDAYPGRSWEDAENDVKGAWESDNEDTLWDDIKEAVQHGWEQVQDAFDGNDNKQNS